MRRAASAVTAPIHFTEKSLLGLFFRKDRLSSCGPAWHLRKKASASF
jgi:hypothetical protein